MVLTPEYISTEEDVRKRDLLIWIRNVYDALYNGGIIRDTFKAQTYYLAYWYHIRISKYIVSLADQCFHPLTHESLKQVVLVYPEASTMKSKPLTSCPLHLLYL